MSVTRNLIYYVLPVSGSDVWQRNVDAVLDRADLFTGLRRVVVAQSDGPIQGGRQIAGNQRIHGMTTDPWEAVAERFGPTFTVTPMKHDPALRETAAFSGLLDEALAHPGVTFFGHAKGVSHPFDTGSTVPLWTAMMYAACLDYWPLVEAAFATGVGAVGAFHRQTSPNVLKRVAVRENGTLHYRRVFSDANWHYSGTFFWFDNERVSRCRDRYPDKVWTGTEFWPGKLFREDQAHALFGRNVGTLYEWGTMNPLLEKFMAWVRDNADHRRAGVGNDDWLGYVLG